MKTIERSTGRKCAGCERENKTKGILCGKCLHDMKKGLPKEKKVPVATFKGKGKKKFRRSRITKKPEAVVKELPNITGITVEPKGMHRLLVSIPLKTRDVHGVCGEIEDWIRKTFKRQPWHVQDRLDSMDMFYDFSTKKRLVDVERRLKKKFPDKPVSTYWGWK